MFIGNYQEKDLEEVYRFYNDNVSQISYKPFDSVSDFKKHIIMDENFKAEGLFIAREKDVIIGLACSVIKKDLLPNETYEKSPGYICLLFVAEDYQNRGIGTALLKHCFHYLQKQGKNNIHFSHKCPLKFSWILPNRAMEHNKAPGVKVDTKGYNFLKKHGFTVEGYECSYCMDLSEFVYSEEMSQVKAELNRQGYTAAYFDSAFHRGQEEMFSRLKDESYRKKFHDDLKRNADILVLLKDGVVCGIAGELYVEKNGRGFFQGLAVDPLHRGKHLSNLLFDQLCRRLKDKGALYMTLFVSENNFIRRLYEKTGFQFVQKWAIMSIDLKEGEKHV